MINPIQDLHLQGGRDDEIRTDKNHFRAFWTDSRGSICRRYNMNSEPEIALIASKVLSSRFQYITVRIKIVEIQLNELSRKHGIISRNYGDEKQRLMIERGLSLEKKRKLYKKIDKKKRDIQEAYDEKTKAHGDLNSAKYRVNSWHNKSKRSSLLFGNTGKPLPKHSMFGQSFGDLDSAKYDRDRAGRSIATAKEKISDLKSDTQNIHNKIKGIKTEIGDLFDQIKEIERGENFKKELENRGYDLNRISIEKQRLKNEAHSLNEEVTTLNKQEHIIIMELKGRICY